MTEAAASSGSPAAPAVRSARAAPVVALGVASAALVAVAADQVWMSAAPTQAGAAPALLAPEDPTPQVPLALALALVALAAWGVLLVARGRARRPVAVLVLLAAAGSTAATVAGWWLVPDQLRTSQALAAVEVEVDVGPWYFVALVAGVAAVLTAAVALLQVPRWPEMGRRYDSPSAPGPDGGGPGSAGPPTSGARSNLDLWRSIDEGEDPTARPLPAEHPRDP